MTLKYGDSLKALYSFKGQKNEDLPFKKGELLTVVKVISDLNWVTCTNSKRQQGLVPMNHVTLVTTPELDEPWYHGDITRAQAEERLETANDGAFLVRSSDKYPGDFTLCVKCENSVQFYHVLKFPHGYTLDEESYFQTMSEMIAHYQDDSDGLCCKLGENFVENNKPPFGYFEDNNFLIDFAELRLGQKIGCGEFSEVLKANYRTREVAVKCFKKTSATESIFTFESSLMAKLNHPNLVTFIGMSYTPEHVYIITEYMENGALVNYLRSRGRAVIKINDQIRFAAYSCRGMCYLEEHCLVHRDLAARNILLNSDLVAKVSDFGLAKVDLSRIQSDSPPCSFNAYPDSKTPDSPSPNKTRDMISELALLPTSVSDDDKSLNRIPVKWTAPEALTQNKYTNKSDVWSFGILLWEIFSFGRTPYPRIYANSVKQHLLNGYRMEAPEDTPKDMYDLMRSCWALEPDKRPTFSHILQLLNNKLKV